MSDAAGKLTEKQKKAVTSLTKTPPNFTAWRISAAKQEAEDAANAEAKAIKNAKIGDIMQDGTIYAGMSPVTKKAMYVTAEDASLSMNFNKAAEYAKGLDVNGRKDWRVPTKEELNVLFDNRERGALKGTFKLTGSNPAGAYWSSTPADANHAWSQLFAVGTQHSLGRSGAASVRCVR